MQYVAVSPGERRESVGNSSKLAQVLDRVDVFPDEHVTCGSDLPLELNDLALNSSFLLLRV